MIEAHLIVWPQIFNCPLFLNMVNICVDFEINLQPIFFPKEGCTAKFHSDLIEKHTNIASWVCYSFSETYLKEHKNFLYLENGILNTNQYFYMDDNGYGVSSNIVTYGDNKKNYSKEFKSEVLQYLKSIEWPIDYGYDKNGHFLIALQSRTDDDIALLTKCERYLPKGIKVLVRPHPNYVTEERTRIYNEFCQKNANWEIDTVKNLFSSLKMTRAVITNFSSVLYRSLAMGIPTATCLPGFHSGTSATLECDRNPAMLQYILDSRFDEQAAQNLICAIHKNSVSKNTSATDLVRNPNFANWLKRMK